MITSRIFYIISSMLLFVAVFILLAPSLISPELIYPLRLDSAYIAFHSDTSADSNDTLLFNPSDVDLQYSDIKITTKDGLHLNGWYVNAEDSMANTVLILHDLNESKILYLDHLKQFHDRGLNVCVFDQRAHGNSEGNEFTIGLPAVEDVKLMADSVFAQKGTKHLVIMGVGVGTAVALQAAIYDNRTEGLILQSPFNTFENYIDNYARSRWGIMKGVWLSIFKRRIEGLLHYSIKQLDLTQIAAYTTIPSLFIIGSDDEKIFTSESLQVFDASATEKKELFLVKNAGHENIAKAGGELYYNHIAAFIVANLPKDQIITRYKKLALQ